MHIIRDLVTTSLPSYRVKPLASGGHGIMSLSTCLCCWPVLCAIWGKQWSLTLKDPCRYITMHPTGLMCHARIGVYMWKIGLYHQWLTAWHLQGWEALSACSHHQCGSNVCIPDFDAAVTALMSYASLLRISYRVRLVVLMPVINRTRCHWEVFGGTNVAKYSLCAPGVAMGFTQGLPWRHQASGNTTGTSAESSWQLGHEFLTKWKRRQIAFSSGESLPV